MADPLKDWVVQISKKHGFQSGSDPKSGQVATAKAGAAGEHGRLAVTVLDGKGKPLAHVTLRVAGTKVSATTKADGKAILEDVPAGSVTIDADFQPVDGEAVSRRETVNVPANKTTSHEISMLVEASPLVNDLKDDDFWKDLEGRAVEGLRHWLQDVYGRAVEQFDTDMHAKKGDDPDAIVWSITKDVLSFVPGTDIPIKVAEISMNVAKLLPHKTSSLEDFLNEARKAKETIGKEVFARKHAFCVQLRQMAQGPQKDDPTHRSKADRAARQALKGLPPFEKILKGMVGDWVKAAKDSYDTDPPDIKAGYVWTVVNLDVERKSWKILTGPFIDDVGQSTGVRKALEHSYGANGLVRDLPYPARASFQIEGYGKGAVFELSKNGAGKFTSCKFTTTTGPGGTEGLPDQAQAHKLFDAFYGKLTIKQMKDD